MQIETLMKCVEELLNLKFKNEIGGVIVKNMGEKKARVPNFTWRALTIRTLCLGVTR